MGARFRRERKAQRAHRSRDAGAIRAKRDGVPGHALARRVLARPTNPLEEVGEMMLLAGRTISSALRPPYPYGGEFVSQFLFVLRLCWFPLMVSTVCINYAAPGLQGANFLTLFGALDRLGGFFVLASIRELGPDVTAIVIAGVAGTAITADLGARKVREELDALQVLGVDPLKNLVVPRFLALMLATGLFNVYAILFGLFGGILAELVNGYPLARSGRRCSPTPTPQTCGLRSEGHDLRSAHLDHLQLQGPHRLRRRRGSRPRRQPSRCPLIPRLRLLRLRLHANTARHPPPNPRDQMTPIESRRSRHLISDLKRKMAITERRGTRPILPRWSWGSGTCASRCC